MKVYADSEYYADVYGGSATIAEPVFREATQIIDEYTLGNVPDDVPENVQMCCCELAEIITRYSDWFAVAMSRQKTSEKVGDLSVGYGSISGSDIEATKKQQKAEIRDVVYRWLVNTGLLYRGVL